MKRLFTIVFLFLAACGTQPPINLDAAFPPAPVVARLQSDVVYWPLDFFKTGETVITVADAALKSLNDIAGLRSTPIGTYSLSIRTYADTANGIQPRMTVKLGKTEIGVVRVRRAVNDYTFQNIVGVGDTLRIILSDDYYDPTTKEDVNIHVISVTFSFNATGGQGKVQLSWDANTEPDLAGYNLYYGLSSRVYGSPINVGISTSYQLNFNDGKTRFFTITAFDTAANESKYSNEIVWTAPTPQDTIKPPKPDTTVVKWPDTKSLRMRVVYQKKDATGKPLLPAIKLQMEKFDSLNSYGWFDKFKGMDYTLTDINDSTSVIEMNTAVLKAGIAQSEGRYLWNVRFRIRLENPTDGTKSTAWVTSDKAIRLFQTVNPLEGVPLLPSFRIIIE